MVSIYPYLQQPPMVAHHLFNFIKTPAAESAVHCARRAFRVFAAACKVVSQLVSCHQRKSPQSTTLVQLPEHKQELVSC